jgi:hypothetical protein
MPRHRGCFCFSFLFWVCSALFSDVMAGDQVYLTDLVLKDKITVSIKEKPYLFGNNLLYFMTTQHINDANLARSSFSEALYLYYANNQLHEYLEQHSYGLQPALNSTQKAISIDPGNGLLYFFKSYIEDKLGNHHRSRLDFEEGCKKKRITGYGLELTRGITDFLKRNSLFNSYNVLITYAYIEGLSLDTSFIVFTSKRAVDVLRDNRVPRETRSHLYKSICDYMKAEEGSLVMLRLPLLVMARSIVQKAPPDIATRGCSIDLGPMIRSSKLNLVAIETYKSTRDMRVLDASPLWQDFTRVEKYFSMQYE